LIAESSAISIRFCFSWALGWSSRFIVLEFVSRDMPWRKAESETPLSDGHRSHLTIRNGFASWLAASDRSLRLVTADVSFVVL
jgi:hypothetical protein